MEASDTERVAVRDLNESVMRKTDSLHYSAKNNYRRFCEKGKP